MIDMKIAKFFFLLIWINLYVGGALLSTDLKAQEYDGTYISGSKATPNAKQALIEKHVHQEVVKTYLQIIGEVIDRIVQQQHIGLTPPIANYALYEIASQGLKQESIKNLTQGAYRQGITMAIDEFEKGSPEHEIKSGLVQAINAQIRPITNDPVFQNIVKYVLEHSMQQQAKVLTQYAVNQKIQETVLKQQYLAQQLKKQYEQTVQKVSQEKGGIFTSGPWSASPWK